MVAPVGPTSLNKAKIDALRQEHGSETSRAERLGSCVADQLATLFKNSGITLGVPMERRVKTWESISDKIERKALEIESITELDDLVGIRVILLFKRDEAKIGDLVRETFKIISDEDTSERLSETQFGYQSHHYVVQLKPEWLAVPSYSDLGSLKVEIQASTLAQHIWAAASHKLQYKQESSVPFPLRRAIHRVSALLETVDLEFERVLGARTEYISEQKDALPQATFLNVDLVDLITSRMLPAANRNEEENFGELLSDLIRLGVKKTDQLELLISQNYEKILSEDRSRVRKIREEEDEDEDPDRTARGVFYTHVGLVRHALSEKFGREKLYENRPKFSFDDDDLPP